MSVFFHHVGEVGSNSDFPKTVVGTNDQLVGRLFNELEPHMSEFSALAKEHFRAEAMQASVPEFQIWGIPSGGERALTKLTRGDHFLLLPTQTAGSRFRYLGKVIARAPQQSFSLSRFLWGTEKFPIIFLMQGEIIDYTWEDFRKNLRYSSNWKLRGKAFRITQEKLNSSVFESESDLINALRKRKDSTSGTKSGAGTNLDLDTADDIASIIEDNTLPVTQKVALVQARLGQGRFRKDVLSRANGRCVVTNCGAREVLRASHIKPWRDCDNIERLDPDNGLSLTANLDALFDRHLITIDDDGALLISSGLAEKDRTLIISQSKLCHPLSENQKTLSGGTPTSLLSPSTEQLGHRIIRSSNEWCSLCCDLRNVQK